MKKYPQLVDSALQLFLQQGFHATGVEQLAADAGLSKKTLYRYFATKEALIDACLQRRDEQFLAALDDWLQPLPEPAQAAGYLAFLAHWTRQADFRGCLFINAAAEYPLLQDAIHQRAAVHKAQLRQRLLQLCIAAGYRQPAGCAAQLLLLGEGLIVSAQVTGSDDSLLQAAQQLVAGWPQDS